MFRRGFRRGAPAQIPPLLRRAIALEQQGDFASAAQAYEEFAARADLRGGPRAPLAFIQAGRMRFLAGDVARGVEHIIRGLDLFAASGRIGKALNAGQRTVQELTARGYASEAQKVSAHLKSILPAQMPATVPSAPGRKPVLPTHCPDCGGPVRSDQVDWIDDATAECDYCGSPIRAE